MLTERHNEYDNVAAPCSEFDAMQLEIQALDGQVSINIKINGIIIISFI